MRTLLLVSVVALGCGCAAEYPQAEMATANYAGDLEQTSEAMPADDSAGSSTAIPGAAAIQRKII